MSFFLKKTILIILYLPSFSYADASELEDLYRSTVNRLGQEFWSEFSSKYVSSFKSNFIVRAQKNKIQYLEPEGAELAFCNTREEPVFSVSYNSFHQGKQSSGEITYKTCQFSSPILYENILLKSDRPLNQSSLAFMAISGLRRFSLSSGERLRVFEYRDQDAHLIFKVVAQKINSKVFRTSFSFENVEEAIVLKLDLNASKPYLEMSSKRFNFFKSLRLGGQIRSGFDNFFARVDLEQPFLQYRLLSQSSDKVSADDFALALETFFFGRVQFTAGLVLKTQVLSLLPSNTSQSTNANSIFIDFVRLTINRLENNIELDRATDEFRLLLQSLLDGQVRLEGALPDGVGR